MTKAEASKIKDYVCNELIAPLCSNEQTEDAFDELTGDPFNNFVELVNSMITE